MFISPRSEGDRCPPGSLVWRQYEVRLTSGRTATLGFSLADPSHKAIARIKREHSAANLGLLVVLDDPDSLEEVVLWFQQATSLTLLSQNGDMMISEEVTALLPRYFTAFFDEAKQIAPDLAEIVLVADAPTTKTNLH